MTRAVGLDLSKWQGTFEPQGNIDFIIQKVSEGLAKDSMYTKLLPAVKTIERRGGYHYFRTEVDPIAQAEFFYKAQANQGFKFLVVDYEKKNNTLNMQGAHNLGRFYEELVIYTSKPILLYTSPYTFRDNLIVYSDEWKDVPLWMAHYNTQDPQIGAPQTWDNDWLFWQYSADGNGKGKEYGVGSTDVDLNVFNGTVAELDEWLGVSPEEPVSPNGENCCEELANKVDVLDDWCADKVFSANVEISNNATEIKGLWDEFYEQNNLMLVARTHIKTNIDNIAGLTSDIGILRVRELAHTREHNVDLERIQEELDNLINRVHLDAAKSMSMDAALEAALVEVDQQLGLDDDMFLIHKGLLEKLDLQVAKNLESVISNRPAMQMMYDELMGRIDGLEGKAESNADDCRSNNATLLGLAAKQKEAFTDITTQAQEIADLDQKTVDLFHMLEKSDKLLDDKIDGLEGGHNHPKWMKWLRLVK